MSVLVNFALFPTDQGTSVSNEVSKIIKCVADSGFKYKLNAMGTVFETETMEQALALIQTTYQILEEHERVYLVINMDIQKDKGNRIQSKINSIEEKIGVVNT
jgi:uncharacterized protein (TIGR00106 family)